MVLIFSRQSIWASLLRSARRSLSSAAATRPSTLPVLHADWAQKSPLFTADRETTCPARSGSCWRPSKRAKTEEEFVVEVDNIIVAVSQYSDFPFINKEEVVVSKAGRIVLDEKGMSSKPYVFAGGDVVRGAATAIQAIADGKKAAVNINNYLGSQSGITVGEEIVLPELEVGKTSVLSAAKMNNLPIA